MTHFTPVSFSFQIEMSNFKKNDGRKAPLSFYEIDFLFCRLRILQAWYLDVELAVGAI